MTADLTAHRAFADLVMYYMEARERWDMCEDIRDTAELYCGRNARRDYCDRYVRSAVPVSRYRPDLLTDEHYEAAWHAAIAEEARLAALVREGIK